MATQSEMTALCRLCLRFSPCMVPLFEALIGEKLLVEVIHVTVGIELDKSFDLPRQVCQDCIEKVNFMYDFQQDLIKCQSMLRMGKDKGDTKFGIAEQTIGIPSEENGIDARSDRSSSVRSESRDLEGSHDEVAGSVHEQIKLESVDIKQEPLDSHNDEMDDPDYVNDIVDFDDSEVQNEQNLDAATTKPNKCYICDTIIESKSELNDHLESHKNMLPFKCLQCSTEANPIEAFHVTALNKHFETHGFQYVCPHCPLRYRTPSSCVYHVRTNHDKNQSEYHCEICGKVFSNLQVYRNHVNAHKNVMTERFKCEPCQKTFHSSKSLRTHQKSLSHDAVIRKKGMGIIISESNENKALAGKRKRKHKAKVDDVEGKTTMSSEEYGASSSIVKMERNDIDDEKPSVPKKRKGYSKIVKTIPNKCHICDTILESKNELVEHLESHKQMLPYKCTQCSTEANPIIYTTLRLLNRHFETHCFNYPCPHCPLRYRNSDTLTYHVRSTHEEQTEEYQCETCGKVLTNVYAFRNHLVVHRNVMMQRYKCELCQKNFRSRHCLDKHQALHFKQQLRAGSVKTKETPQEMSNADAETVEQKYNPTPIVKTEPIDPEGTIDHDELARQSTDEESNDSEKDESSRSNEPIKFKRGTKVAKIIPTKCYVCGTILGNETEFDEHLKSHKDMLPYKCGPCSTDVHPIVALTVVALNKHFQRHEFNYVCPHCPFRYRKSSWLTGHIRRIHEEKTIAYTCETCGKGFTKINHHSYLKHINRHKDLITQRYKCEPCQRVFPAEVALKRHKVSFLCIRNTERMKTTNTNGMNSMPSNDDSNDKAFPGTAEKTIAARSDNQNEDAYFSPELIKLEPLGIKTEPNQSDYEEMVE
ncbi:zinc finger protein 208-like isoform X1 [Toxorhynchites rutilus septentrionalis]|uniref:zinc finger protein 208-like isoform X1 n=1 Tax=Toxorhynchites rutilus septentrionalis TaxID=329112 RepID=UPI00247AF372|nr:zinc finger protein 208-like isoform X1 [Toxorhynchites rutilus septentrionalis]